MLSGADGTAFINRIQIVRGSIYGDTLVGANAGKVTIDGGGGPDSIIGGYGYTAVTFANSTNAVKVDLTKGTETGYGSGTTTIQGNIQEVIGSAFNDSLKGNRNSTQILDGGAGGDDTFDPGGGGTLDNFVTIKGSQSGINTITLQNANTGFGAVVDLAHQTINGGYGAIQVSNIQKVIGTRYDDTMIADNHTLLLDGGLGGNDLFDTNQATAITVKGGSSGKATITLANENGIGAAGAALVDLSQGSLSGAYGNATLVNITGVIGTAHGNDTLIAGSKSVDFQTGDGNVSMVGSTFNDTLKAGAGNATIKGGGGDDLIIAVSGKATSDYSIITGSGDDTITVGQGKSHITIGGGADIITAQSNLSHVSLDFSQAGVPSSGGVNVDLVNNFFSGIDAGIGAISGADQIETIKGSAGRFQPRSMLRLPAKMS